MILLVYVHIQRAFSKTKRKGKERENSKDGWKEERGHKGRLREDVTQRRREIDGR